MLSTATHCALKRDPHHSKPTSFIAPQCWNSFPARRLIRYPISPPTFPATREQARRGREHARTKEWFITYASPPTFHSRPRDQDQETARECESKSERARVRAREQERESERLWGERAGMGERKKHEFSCCHLRRPGPPIWSKILISAFPLERLYFMHALSHIHTHSLSLSRADSHSRSGKREPPLPPSTLPMISLQWFNHHHCSWSACISQTRSVFRTHMLTLTRSRSRNHSRPRTRALSYPHAGTRVRLRARSLKRAFARVCTLALAHARLCARSTDRPIFFPPFLSFLIGPAKVCSNLIQW